MAINDIIPREQGDFLENHGDFDHGDAHMQTVFEQHACRIPLTDDMAVRQAPALFTGTAADPMVDRNKNMFIPELLSQLVFEGTEPQFPTPDKVSLDPGNPDHVLIGRQGPISIEIPTPLGPVEVWPFEDTINSPDNDPPWPSAPIRVREGQLVHTELSTRFSSHTIHNHAVEPSAMNDGVGHITFEVNSGKYNYQWHASEAGTYFYHCHKNTTLHFEMGMYGMLIIDPNVPGAPFATGGPGVTRRGNQLLGYDAEAIWAVDEFDLTWRSRALEIGGHSVGIECPWYHVDENGNPTGEFNPGLNQFNPEVFLISGIASPWTMPGASGSPFPNGAAIFAQRGQRVLLRLLNAGYCTQQYTFGVPLEVLAMDSRTLGYSGFMRYSQPFQVAANTPFTFTTARRWDLLIDTATLGVGNYPVKMEFFDWITGQKKGELETLVVVQ